MIDGQYRPWLTTAGCGWVLAVAERFGFIREPSLDEETYAAYVVADTVEALGWMLDRDLLDPDGVPVIPCDGWTARDPGSSEEDEEEVPAVAVQRELVVAGAVGAASAGRQTTAWTGGGGDGLLAAVRGRHPSTLQQLGCWRQGFGLVMRSDRQLSTPPSNG